MGFAKTGSKPSLIAGVGSGLAIVALELFASRSSSGISRALSAAQALGAGGLAFTMVQRYVASGKVMPAGAVAALSALACVVFLARAASATAVKRA